ncbi:YD repeat-containing protein, partial [Paracidovorax valerianellae]
LINENQAVTRFVHDAADRLVQEVGFDGRTQAYGYDAAGQLVHKSDGHGAGHHPGLQGAAAQGGLSATVCSRTHYDDGGRVAARVLVRSAGLQSDEQGETLQIHAYEHDGQGALAAARTWTAHLPWSQAQAKAQSLGEQWLDLPAALLRALLAPTAEEPGTQPDPALAEAAQRLQAHRLIADTCVALERDAFGRATGEAQTLYRQAPATPHSGGDATPEFEHRIAHRLGALGQRLGSQLQGLGELDWLAYGSGHVHGLLLDKTPLLAIERDALHREVGRTLQLDNGQALAHAADITQARRLDPMGRLLQQDWQGLPRTDAAQASGPLAALTVRRYTYDTLGQLVGVQTPAHATRYHYDVHQRLTGVAHAGAEGVSHRRWHLDPAGNRLPDRLGRDAAPGGERQDWASQVRQNLQDPGFDLLQQSGNAPGSAGGPVQQWPGNRIGWSSAGDGAIVQYRYDAFGNRVQAQHADGRTLRLQYDALHQLTAVFEQAPGEKGFTPIARYRYDAFGRRLGKTVVREGREDTTHYGWDADRLVHTEDRQGIRHTVYEPASFVPLLQLQRRQGAKDAVQLLMDLGAEPGEDTTDAANSFAAMPRAQREMVQAALQSV